MPTASFDDDNIVRDSPTPLFPVYSRPMISGSRKMSSATPSFLGCPNPGNMISESLLKNSTKPSFSLYPKSTNTDDLHKPASGPDIIIVTVEERFPEEAAVCKICFKKFETQNMVMTKCNCPKALLIHEECIPKSAMNGNNECNVCEQVVMNFAVKWRSESIESDSIPSTSKQGKRSGLLKSLGFKCSKKRGNGYNKR